MVRNDGAVAIGTSTYVANTMNIGSNVTMSGTIAAAGLTGTMSAANISAGQFGSNTGGGNYYFPGNVGVGYTSPGYNLDVNGNIGLVSSPTGGLISHDNSGHTLFAMTRQTNDLSIQSFAGIGLASNIQSGIGSTAYALYVTGSNVGIGTTGPIAPLSIVGTNSNTLTLTRQNVTAVAGNTAAAIDFRIDQGTSGGASGQALQARIESSPQDGWGGNLVLYTKPNDGNPSGSLAERMRIRYDGNVGIATTSPAYKLDVNGTIRSETGGVMFPDGTTQTTAYLGASQTLSAGNISAGTFGANTGGGSYVFTGSVQDGGSGVGTVTLVPGDATHSGYINFYPASGGRLGYLGYQTGSSGLGFWLDAGGTFSIGNAGAVSLSGNFSDTNSYGQTQLYTSSDGYTYFETGNVAFNGNLSGGMKVAGYNANAMNNFQVSATNSYFSGNVGVGAASPGAKLDVSGTLRNTGLATLSYTNYSNSAPQVCVGDCQYGFSSSGGSLYIWELSTGSVYFNTGATFSGTVTASGFSGPLTGTESAANVSAGTFGANTGNGNYTFPGTLTVSGAVTGGPVYWGYNDIRTISPSSFPHHAAAFGFDSYNNNNTYPWADFMALNSYNDSSGGNDNLLLFNRSSGLGIRLYQQTWNSGTAFSTYKDVVLSENSPSANYLTKYSGTGNTVSVTNASIYDGYTYSSAYNSSNAFIATPTGIQTTGSFLQFTGGNAIAPYSMYRTSGDWPAPYGIGWGTGGESAGIFQHYASNGSSLGEMTFYINNDGSGSWSWVNGGWEGTTYNGSGSNKYTNKVMTLDGSGNLTLAGTVAATGFTGPLTGTENAGNVSAGTFGANTGSGNYTFPAQVNALDFYATENSDGVATFLDSTNNSYATRLRYRTAGNERWSLDARGSGEGYDMKLYNDNGSWNVMEQWKWDNSAVLFPTGSVGIGTASPVSPLDVVGNTNWASGWRYGITVDSTDYPTLRLRSGHSGSPIISALGNDNDGSMYFMVGGTDSSMGTTAAYFNADGSGYLKGSIGINTGSPSYTLDVNGGFRENNNWAISGAAQASLNMNGNNLTGVNKIYVTTIDPVYNIDGAQYATYGPESVGVMVMQDGTGQLAAAGNGSTPGSDYTYAIDFANAAKGSDLWLFWQTVSAGEGMKNISITFAPEGKAVVLWYELKPAAKAIVIHGDQPIAFSYHLSAPRYDTTQWPNVLTGTLAVPGEGVTLTAK